MYPQDAVRTPPEKPHCVEILIIVKLPNLSPISDVFVHYLFRLIL